MHPISIIGGKRVVPLIEQSIIEGGGEIVPVEEAEGLIFLHPNKPEILEEILKTSPKLEWIQLPYAGIEPYIHLLNQKIRWTCGKGIYAGPVAEMALTFLLMSLRGLNTYARAKDWEKPKGTNLFGAKILILGGGGICEELVKLLQPFNCQITIARKHKKPLNLPDNLNPEIPYQIKTIDELPKLLGKADAVVVALSLTPETENIINAKALELMSPHSWIINVARGKHIDTDALVEALEANSIGGACLDVTEPEPLPPDHPLWNMENCIITPHVGNTPEMGMELLKNRVKENVKLFCEDKELLGPVYVELGY